MRTGFRMILFAAAALLMGSVQSYAQDQPVEYVVAPKLRIAVDGGYGRRLASYQSTGNELVDNHNKRLFGGLIYGGELTYYFGDSFGVGVKYSDLHSISKDSVMNDAGQSGLYSEAVDIMFVGPMMSSRLVNASGKGIFMLNYGLGYIGYDDAGRVISDEIDIRSSALGYCLELGYDYKIMNNIFLGASLGAISGVLNNYTQTINGYSQKVSLGKDERESLLHGYLTLGLRYYL